MRLTLELVVAVAAIAGGVAALRSTFLIVRVEGVSMQPTLAPGSRLLVRRGGIGRVRRGSVVVLAPPPDAMRTAGDPNVRRMIKRAVALPGDLIPREAVPVLVTERVVPAGRLVVLGDNAERSLDSRALGYFDADELLGVVIRAMT